MSHPLGFGFGSFHSSGKTRPRLSLLGGALRCPSLTFEFLLAFCAVFFLCFVVVLWRCRLRGVEHHRRVGMAPSTSFWTISHGFPGYMPPRTRRGTHSTILCRGNLGSDEGWCFFSFFFGPFPLFMVILYDPYSKPRPDTIRPSSRYDHRGTGLKRQPSSLPSLPQHSHRPCLSGADWCLHSDVVCPHACLVLPMHAWYSGLSGVRVAILRRPLHPQLGAERHQVRHPIIGTLNPPHIRLGKKKKREFRN